MKYRTLNITLSLCCILGVALPAWAHAHVETTLPPAGAHLSVAPKQIEIRFTEGIEPALSEFKLLNSKTDVVPLARDADDGDNRHMSASIPVPLTPGDYSVEWKALSQDGHPASGQFDFLVSP
jgi:methionine-rich copper-binding protein CopC